MSPLEYLYQVIERTASKTGIFMLRMILSSKILQIFHKNIAAFVLKYLFDSIYIARNSKICLNLDEKQYKNMLNVIQ